MSHSPWIAAAEQAWFEYFAEAINVDEVNFWSPTSVPRTSRGPAEVGLVDYH